MYMFLWSLPKDIDEGKKHKRASTINEILPMLNAFPVKLTERVYL